MKIQLDQIAIVTPDMATHTKARHFFQMGGASFDAMDTVTAVGFDDEGKRIRNKAELSFTYNVWPNRLEHEVLTYIDGWNWHRLDWLQCDCVHTSHFGMHLQDSGAIEEWKRNYKTLQEVVTIEHTNARCADRRYRYIILNTRAMIGAELKLIQRLTLEEGLRWREVFEG